MVVVVVEEEDGRDMDSAPQGRSRGVCLHFGVATGLCPVGLHPASLEGVDGQDGVDGVDAGQDLIHHHVRLRGGGA